jgi:hypothetical protein
VLKTKHFHEEGANYGKNILNYSVGNLQQLCGVTGTVFSGQSLNWPVQTIAQVVVEN